MGSAIGGGTPPCRCRFQIARETVKNFEPGWTGDFFFPFAIAHSRNDEGSGTFPSHDCGFLHGPRPLAASIPIMHSALLL
jgi:hypothetical protein